MEQSPEGPEEGTHRALELRAAEQAAIAELGLLALGGTSPQELMDAVVSAVAETLGLEDVAVIEYPGEADAPRLRAGLGWRMGDAAIEDAPSGTTVDIRCRESTWGKLEV